MRCEICDKMSMSESPCKECQEIIYIASHTMEYRSLSDIGIPELREATSDEDYWNYWGQEGHRDLTWEDE